MRKLPVVDAVRHALTTVIAFRAAGVRIGLIWMIMLVAVNVAAMLTVKDQSPNGSMGPFDIVQIVVGMVAFYSIAVNWHRFVLRDEMPVGHGAIRIDMIVWRYTGTALLIALMTFVPVAVLAAVLSALLQPAVVLVLPALAAAGTAALMLSLRLPAIALGRTDIDFTTAMRAAEGNFWQIMGVFALSALVVFLAALVLVIFGFLLSGLPRPLAIALGLIAGAAVNLFVILFSVSTLTSLYGFFIERRDF